MVRRGAHRKQVEREGSSEKGGERKKKARARKPRDGGEEGREGGRRAHSSDGSYTGCSITIVWAAHLQHPTF